MLFWSVWICLYICAMYFISPFIRFRWDKLKFQHVTVLVLRVSGQFHRIFPERNHGLRKMGVVFCVYMKERQIVRKWELGFVNQGNDDIPAAVNVSFSFHFITMCLSNKLHLCPIGSSHKSHNASDKYPTMHHFVTDMCTHVYISLAPWHTLGYGTSEL